MKKKTFLSKFAARFMAAALMVSSVAMTGCYKDDGLDVTFPGGSVVVPDATYAISGTVSDYETGAAVNLTEVITSAGTAKVDGNGAFHVALTKADVPESGVTVNLTFKAEGYDDVQRSVFVKHIADGSSVVYPLSVTVKKAAEVVEYVDVVYNLKFIVKNAETGEAISNITPVVEGTADANGNYAAGEYVVTTPAVEGQYYASATAVSLPEAQVVKGENNVRTSVIELNVIPVVDEQPKPEAEYVKVYGEILDNRGILATAQRVILKGIDIEPLYNTSSFSFTVNKEKFGACKLIAEVKNANETGVIQTTAGIEPTEVDAYYVVLEFGCKVVDGKESVEEGGNNSGSLVPDIENDEVQETVSTTMADGTTITLEKGTQTNLGNRTLFLVRNKDAEEVDENSVSIRSYIGLPDGATFNPGLKIGFADIYGGQLGNNFYIEYQAADGSWSKDAESTVSLAGNIYTMDIRHFSTFRASLNYDTESATESMTTTDLQEINYMNSNEESVDYTLTYEGYEGTKYADYAKLQADVAAAFSNEKAQALVMSIIKNLCPEAKEDYTAKTYTGKVTIPGWTLLNTADVTTVKETATYTLTINGKSITFSVEKIASVTLSATDKNMTHVGHGHGHGHGDDNNAGGGIIVNE